MQFLYCRVKYADLFVLPIYIVIYVLSLKGFYFYSNLLNSYPTQNIITLKYTLIHHTESCLFCLTKSLY